VRYESINGLPTTIRDVLPEDAQRVYLEAYNRAWDGYNEEIVGDLTRDGVANRAGWTVVEHEFVQDSATGEWHRKGEELDQEAGQGVLSKLKSLFG
jgi:cation transport regulator